MAPRRTLLLLPLAAASLLACDDGDSVVGVVRCGPGEVNIRGFCVPDTDAIEDRDAAGGDAADATTVDLDAAPADVVAVDLGGGGDSSPPACVDGTRRCSESGEPMECVGGLWDTGAPCPGDQSCVAGVCTPGVDCEPGLVVGCFDATARRVCNDAGDTFDRDPCPEGDFCFRGTCGSQICEPGQLGCDDSGRYVQLCAPSGEEWVRTEDCNPRENLACVAGECVSGCAAALKDPTYIGCEYWSVDLPQYQDPFGDPRAVPHAVVLANTGDRPADVTITTRGDVPVVTSSTTIAAGAVGTITFPRADVENTSRSFRSFKIATTEPVVAYQFNPLNDVGVASNDASLLLPASAIGREYYVMSYPSGVAFGSFAAQTGWFTIVATREGTTRVTITFTSDVLETPGTALLSTPADMRGILAGSTHTFEMSQFEVLNFEAKSALFAIGDLTGSHILADRPIVVFGGHEEAVIGEGEGDDGPCCADHLEEQLFPVETWGTRILAVHSPPRGREADVWRVLAAYDGTRITTVPPIPGLDGITLSAGGFAEVSTTQSFEVIGTEPILVAQYLVSQLDVGISSAKGDPSMILAVPALQYRDDYAVLVPSSYAEDWITVVRPAGQTIELDGVAIPDSSFEAFGTVEYERAYARVTPGPHRFVCPSECKFGIAGFGYNSAVSYGYPGGLNLATEF
ncbi:MAG: IgGFc-binding protein [Myxococcales bacterium]|nr:IgGFc-binding protein [Myxococcales bacterium]MCB9531571.1 IgGFc-binding protein [Myxococcales bacterium]MCB9532778.1 IgGFc-binding protein [Myxococcales bacterium]